MLSIQAFTLPLPGQTSLASGRMLRPRNFQKAGPEIQDAFSEHHAAIAAFDAKCCETLAT